MRAFPIVLIGALAITAPQVGHAAQPAAPALTLIEALCGLAFSSYIRTFGAHGSYTCGFWH